MSAKLDKAIRRLCIALAALLVFAPAAADENMPNYVERIEAESEGSVTFDIPDNVLDLIFSGFREEKKPQKSVKANVLHSGVNKLSGYRIQVFSQGHGQGSVEARAKARGSAVVAKFPKYRGQVYSYSKSPNWYTRVGNFQTAAEANRALAELKRAFPQFAGEMRLVRCQITIVK